MDKISVLGGGSWGTTLANLLAEKDLNVSVWARDPKIFVKNKKILINKKYLPKYNLSPNLKIQKNIKSLRKGSEALIITDDPMAEIDLKHFCLNNNYILTEVKNEQDGGRQFFSLKKDQ